MLTDNCTLLMKMYYSQILNPVIPTTKVNYQPTADIKCLLPLVAVVPLLEVVKALVVFGQSLLCTYVISQGH